MQFGVAQEKETALVTKPNTARAPVPTKAALESNTTRAAPTALQSPMVSALKSQLLETRGPCCEKCTFSETSILEVHHSEFMTFVLPRPLRVLLTPEAELILFPQTAALFLGWKLVFFDETSTVNMLAAEFTSRSCQVSQP